MFSVKEIKAESTYDIRLVTLYPHGDIEDSKFEIDNKEGTFHLGAFYGDKLVSVVSFCLENHPDFSFEKQYRLRGMGTLEDFRKLGAGKELVSYGEDLIREKKVNFLWCEARTLVEEYYKKIGFIAHGQVFEYPLTGPHIIMYKNLE